jgi:polyhydroxyalkanoate synthesis regulator phasin
MHKNLRTPIIGALAAVGLLVGATFALAQSNEDPAPAADTSTTSLEEIAEDLEAEVAPLLDEIKAKTLEAIDDAVAAGALTEDQADVAREGVEGYGLPEGFPFRLGHRLPWFEFDGFEPGCFGSGPDAAVEPEDCPELPEGFPFQGPEFRFGPMPEHFDLEKLERFGADIEEFIEDLDFDFEQLEELLESGMSPEEALEEMGLELEAVLSEAREAALEKIDELVADGTISEEKAAMFREMLEGIDVSAGFPFGLNHFDFDPGDFGGWGPHGHHHGGEDTEEG